MFDAHQIILHGLTYDEFDLALEIIGRQPNMVELGIFSVMWSEHCSYKSSRTHLKNFPTTGPQVIHGPGENAGVVDIGDGLAVVFKMESHNHPSYIEPYQGAATGVGGILRDVFTMGARPYALLDSLRFGDPSHPKTKYLLDGVVAGIAGYGNCMGVPTIGGELSFHPSYNGNCLVNAFNLGIVNKDRIFLGTASGVGNPVMYVGSKTGRDGIHGATMASAEFGDGGEERRPTVQVGDPFTEKQLLEALLELFKTDYVVGIQDMGAAGLTSSSFEMAGRAGTGVELDIEKVPRREEGMNPYEVMLSESQERMLLVCHKGVEDKIKAIFEKWGLSAEVVGRVTGDGMVRIMEKGQMAAELPAAPLSQKAPMYSRPASPPDDLAVRHKLDHDSLPQPKDYTETLSRLLASPNLCSREWVYNQYDHMVRTNTIEKPGSDAAVIRVKGTSKAVAMSLDCNSRYCYLDPYMGGAQAVAEATRNVACSGAKPLAITDCLNFGSPEKPEVMWQFIQAIKGMSDACIALGTPVVSGNVSFYNQTGETAINPTPSIGAMGLLEDHEKLVSQYFSEEGDVIIVLGETFAEIGGSEYLSVIHGQERGAPPKVDLTKEAALQKTLVELADKRLVKSMHDVSDGGLGVALMECCFKPGTSAPLGFEVSLATKLRPDIFFFSESQSRAVISCNPAKAKDILALAKKNGVPALNAGKTSSGDVEIMVGGRVLVKTSSATLKKAWSEALPKMMNS
ncbi:MAG: phosphoribosylformylglycinamidine synthase subunit PurL [Nitrospinae bacterium]|nr:phosphoribosylformylglycinamidine synthase subunit PurL [Nitrospinota bacterium]MBF0634483.1 phosphoribosylformylglycinamidine synthase subunit PurL [Nitrospinota bacterium]